jgi:serine protease Do
MTRPFASPATAALALVLLGCEGASRPSAAQSTGASSGARASAGARVSESRQNAITTAVARVAPAVVTVQTEVVERVPADMFEQFFGRRSAERSTPGLGTGFIIRADGIVVTNAHVTAGATSITVMMRDGKTYTAQQIGADETNDIAVLRLTSPPKDLPLAPLGNSGNLLVGEWAIAIGNPFGFVLGNPEPSVSVGVISGVGRNLVARGEGPSAYFDMIQTDAAINPGNSGGPLVTADGEVVGVNSSIYSTSGGSIGLGFAIPINRVRRVVDDLLEHGALRRPWVGLKLELDRQGTTRDAIATGARVGFVTPGSPADRAGVKTGDVIVRAGDRQIRNVFDWEAELLDLRVGETVQLTVQRGGRESQLRVTIADLPEVGAPKVEVLREVQLVTLTPAIRAERNVRSPNGALVYNLSPRMAQTLGLAPGDVIVQINRTPVGSADEAARAIDYYAGRGPITIFFEHAGQLLRSDFVLR